MARQALKAQWGDDYGEQLARLFERLEGGLCPCRTGGRCLFEPRDTHRARDVA